jgi:hypothetical protein
MARKLTIRAPCYYVSTDRDSDSESPRIQAGDDPLVGPCSMKTRPRQAVASVGLYGPWRAAGVGRSCVGGSPGGPPLAVRCY